MRICQNLIFNHLVNNVTFNLSQSLVQPRILRIHRISIVLIFYTFYLNPIFSQVCISNTTGGLNKTLGSFGCGNSFIPPQNTLNGLTVFGESFNGTVNVTLSIYSGAGTTGTLLYQQPGLSIVPNNPNVYALPAISVTPGNTYTWFLSSNNIVNLKGGNNAYTDGIFYRWDFVGGPDVLRPSEEADFEISCSNAVPTLSQWGMIILGLLFGIFGIVGVRKYQLT